MARGIHCCPIFISSVRPAFLYHEERVCIYIYIYIYIYMYGAWGGVVIKALRY